MSNISNNSTTVPDEVDIIVAGGGAAGCTLAGRLAAADPSLSILIIEAGINNKDVPSVIHPALFLTNLTPDSKTAVFHVAKASEHLNGRQAIVPVGGCLGGGSSINFMMYTRGQAVDYDAWNTEGWSSKDLIPLLKKTETYHNDRPDINRDVHGYNGPFHASHGGYVSQNIVDDCLEANKDIGIREVSDANDLHEANGMQRWLKWIHPETGRRQDAAHVLVHPILESNRTGLQVLTEHKVVKVLTENGRAVGVEYTPNLGTQTVTPSTESLANPKCVRARKLVVVSSGALSTPCILERSGIGSQDVLSKAGVQVVTDLPGVGNNYMDHNLLINVYTSNLPEEEGFDAFLDGRRSFDEHIKAFDEPSSKKYIAWSGLDVTGKIRPTESEVATGSEHFKELYDRDYANSPDRPLFLSVLGAAHVGDHSMLEKKQYMSTATFLSYPYGRGSVHITGSSITDPTDFDSGILSHEFDLEALVISWKRQREVVRRMKSFAGPEGIILGPKFKEGSKGSRWDWPTENGAYVEYEEEDNEAIRQFVKDNVATTWHSAGTCAMKPKEDGGVVDGKLNVYGIEGLKVADLSIMPSNVSGNTYSTALLVGEKAATIIAEELGIKNF